MNRLLFVEHIPYAHTSTQISCILIDDSAKCLDFGKFFANLYISWAAATERERTEGAKRGEKGRREKRARLKGLKSVILAFRRKSQ